MRERDLADVALFRQRAEEELARRHSLEQTNEPSHTGICKTIEEHRANIHELEVCRMVLEMQYQELQKAIEKAATATALYEFSPAGYFTLESDGRISELNINGACLLGKGRNDLLGANFIDFVSDDTKHVFRDFLRENMESKTRQVCEIKLAVDGKPFTYTYLEGFVCETTQYCLITAVDITEQKCSEEAIRTSETQLKRAELVSKTGNWELHLDTQKMYASDGAFKIYGADKGDISLEKIKTFPLPEYRSFLNIKMQKLIEENEAYDVEFKIRAADTGEIKDIHSIATYDTEKRRVFGTLQDITQQKRLEQRIHESEQYYRSMIEASPDAIVIVDTHGHLQFASHKAYEIFKIPANYPVKGSPLVGWIAPEMREPTMLRFHGIITGQIASEPFEYKILLLDGSTLWAEIHGSLLKDINGSVEGLFLICRNVSERKRTEEAIRESEFFFKQSQKAALIGSYKIDVTTGLWKSSEVLNQIFGISGDREKSLEEWVAVVHTDDRESMKNYFCEHVVNQRNPFNKDYRIVRKSDGAVRWVYGLGELETDDNGNV
ncbi:MAG TPA: PAS domain S-box protein, partial [Prolixibacteraceae bacterium]|nr:PAS domain S-box protein [Prolixibacteraceae bacterium]